jgi:hypothetical protein
LCSPFPKTTTERTRNRDLELWNLSRKLLTNRHWWHYQGQESSSEAPFLKYMQKFEIT